MADTRMVLVGRDRHLRELESFVDAVVAGSGYVIVLSGEAGAGKTALAHEAVRIAELTSVRVRWATCWRSSTAPLSVWTELVDAAGTGSARTPLASGSDADPGGARAAWVRAVARHFLHAVEGEPTLLVVDDLQWVDPLSSHVLAVLAGLVRGHVGLLCTVRDDALVGGGHGDLLGGRSRDIDVPPLSESELAALAVDLTGASLTPGTLRRLHDRTGGNVLFAKELLTHSGNSRDLLDERRPSRSTAVAIFAERVATLSVPCQQVLQSASVIGRRFRVDVLAETMHTDAEHLLDPIGEAVAVGLLRAGGIGVFEFSHPLVAEACYEAGGFPRRVRLHRDVAEAMERLRTRGVVIPAVEIAHHFANASPAGVAAKAAEYAALAGREDMAQLAYEDAVRDFGLALQARELCEADDSSLAELLLDLGDAQAASGDRRAARDTYERAARLARDHGWSAILARAALGVGSGPGGFEIPPFDRHQIALLEEAAASTVGPLRSRVLARLSVARALDAEATEQRSTLSAEAIRLARESGEPAALGYALASWCDVMSGPGSMPERLTATDEILRCAAEAHDTGLELLGRRLRVVALLEAGRIGEFDAEVAAFASSADRIGQSVYSWYVPLWQAMRAAMDGRLDAADELRDTAETIGAAANSENALLLVASQRAMLQCELREATDAIVFFEEILAQYPDYAIMVLPAQAYALAATGEVQRARDVVATLDPSQYTVDALGSEFLTTVMMTAHAAWLSGYGEHADALYAALLPYRSSFAVDGIAGYLVGSVERTLGVLATQQGDRELARAHFGAALDAHRRVRSPLLLAGTLRDAGTCLDDERMTAEADEQFAAIGCHAATTPRAAPASPATGSRFAFRRMGDVWYVAWEGRVVHVRHSKGLGDLARLIAKPHTEVHVLDLVEAGPVVEAGSTGEAIDATARRQYRDRLELLEADLVEADRDGDMGGSERLHAEREALIAELSAAYGLGGRARRRGDSSERARSAVTQRIRDAITRIERVLPELGGHLHRAVRTGTYCAYEPESPVDWQL
jgi:tetratricopeptide (TPR) repeat protein